MRQSEKDDVEPVEIRRVGRRIDEAWVGAGECGGVAHRLSFMAAGCRHHHLDSGWDAHSRSNSVPAYPDAADNTDLHGPHSSRLVACIRMAARILQLYASF